MPVEVWNARGCSFKRELWQEVGGSQIELGKVRVTWGEARLHSRSRDAVWNGETRVPGKAKVIEIQPFSGTPNVPEETVKQTSETSVVFPKYTQVATLINSTWHG
jgi:hypothetical protein